MSESHSDPNYDDLRAKLCRGVACICPRWLAGRREDIVQVALMKVMQLHRRGEGQGEYSSSYLWKVAYSVVVDEIRRERRRGEVSLESDGPEHHATAPEGDPERVSADREIGAGITECLSRLVKARRLAVALYLQGHTVPETAGLLGWTPKRADNSIYRGLADLRECLRSKGLNP